MSGRAYSSLEMDPLRHLVPTLHAPLPHPKHAQTHTHLCVCSILAHTHLSTYTYAHAHTRAQIRRKNLKLAIHHTIQREPGISKENPSFYLGITVGEKGIHMLQ